MVAPKIPESPDQMNKLLEVFLQAKQDGARVHDVEQRLELHVTTTTAYLPSYTRQVMDTNNGAPVMAIHTRTDAKTKRVFLHPAANPADKAARKLRSAETMGPAYFAFGVPLRALGLKFPASRRIVLPMGTLEVPDQGIVYWVSFANIEKEARNVSTATAAAAKQAAPRKTKAGKETKDSTEPTPPQG
ncbi:MAG TPA: hypothetical protein VD969_21270 [Symbiobacteriaceae bacterium]|nr:hypothetical protein [Symbiobacteriaceae bacterium]